MSLSFTSSLTTSTATTAAPKQDRPRKLRSACDGCHRSKTRCSGGNPCTRCHEYLTPCTYSYSSRCGKPKGARSRRTLDQVAVAEAVAEAAETPAAPAETARRLAGNPATATPSHSTVAATGATNPNPSLCLWDEEEESNPILSSSSDTNTGVTVFSTAWIPPLPSIPDSDLLFPPLETTSDPFFWCTIPEPECQPASKELLDPPSRLLRSCQCLQILRSLTSRDIRRCDAMFVFVRNFARAFSGFYQCPHCPKDAGSISMAVTALQLATTALERTTSPGAEAAVLQSGMTPIDLEDDLFSSSFLPHTPSAELLLPSSSSSATSASFQLGSYQVAPLQGEHDAEEHTEILNILIRSAVRRLLAVCWQIWDLLRGPVSSDHDRSCSSSSSSSSSSASSFSFAPDNNPVFDLSCSAETAQFRSTLVQIPARLCNLLA